VREISATSTQVVIGWNSASDCTVQAKLDDGNGPSGYAGNANPVVFDLDTTKYGSTADDPAVRYPSLQFGSFHEFVIGTELTPNWLAFSSGGYPSTSTVGALTNYSPALQQGANYVVQVCGSDGMTIEASTLQLPPGISWPYPPAVAPNGNYAWPSINFQQ